MDYTQYLNPANLPNNGDNDKSANDIYNNTNGGNFISGHVEEENKTIPITSLPQASAGNFSSIQNDLNAFGSNNFNQTPQQHPHKHSSGVPIDNPTALSNNNSNIPTNASLGMPQAQFQQNNGSNFANSTTNNNPNSVEHSASQNVPTSSLAKHTTKNIPAIEITRKIGIKGKRPVSMFNPANPFVAGKMTTPEHNNNREQQLFNMNPNVAPSDSVADVNLRNNQQPNSTTMAGQPNNNTQQVVQNTPTQSPQTQTPQKFSSIDLQGTVALPSSSAIDGDIPDYENIPAFSPHLQPNNGGVLPTQNSTTNVHPGSQINNAQNKTQNNSKELPNDLFKGDLEETPFTSYIPQHAVNSSPASRVLPFMALLFVALIVGLTIAFGIIRATGNTPPWAKSIVQTFPQLAILIGDSSSDLATTDTDVAGEHGASQDQLSPGSSSQSQTSDSDSNTSDQTPTQINKSLSITIMNGTGRAGVAQKNAIKLEEAGYLLPSPTNLSNLSGQVPTQNTVFYKTNGDERTAKDIARILGIDVVLPDQSAQTEIVVKIVS